VGAGIVGLTVAELLARAGKSVVVLEALRVGTQATALSTAKVTSQHGLIYGRLIRDFGEHNARLYAQANQDAIDYIAGLVDRTAMECAFERKAAYVYTQSPEDTPAIEDEAMAVSMLGLPAQLVDVLPAPLAVTRALRFDGQAQFHPVQYLAGLAAAAEKAGAAVHEDSRVTSVKADGNRLRVSVENGPDVDAGDVLVATHLPVVPEGKFYAKAFTFSHTAAAAPIDPAMAPDGMFISAGQPTRSFRVDASGGSPCLVAIGPTYKTGVLEEETHSFEALERFMRDTFSIETLSHRWTNEDFKSMDGMPFVGRASSSTPRLYVATGFDAWGITNGTAAARLLSDLVLGAENPLAALFDASRMKPLAGGTEFVKENLLSAKHFVADRLSARTAEGADPQELAPGHAAVLRQDGKDVAAYRDDAGRLHTVSAVCSHMGCLVGWNDVDRTWDCPCHGSRFGPDGGVLHGPASSALEPLPAAD